MAKPIDQQEITKDMLTAIYDEVKTIRAVINKFPDMPIREIRTCFCMGPGPGCRGNECRCAMKSRLIGEFIEIMEKREAGNG